MKRSCTLAEDTNTAKKNFKSEMSTNWNFRPKTNVPMVPLQNFSVLPSGEGTSKMTKESAVAGSNFQLNGTNDGKKSNRQEDLDQSRSNFFGKSMIEKTYFFTGNVERVIKWHRIFNNRCCYYEVIASIVSLQEGPINLQKIILLKDKKGPILQVIHYLNHVVQIEEFKIGQMLRCVGYMTGTNVLTAISMRAATPEEIATLKRYCYISDFSISGLLNAEDNNV